LGKKARVVVDTGVLVSAFVFGGLPKEALLYLFKKTEIWISPDILNEYRQVPLELEEKGKISHEQLKLLIAGIAAFIMNAQIAYPNKSLSICRDEEDNMILEACLAAKADYLITGDRDLLEIDSRSLKATGLKKLRIFTPREFLSTFE
jgi:putative PIN family toxin of toxin-antitoxin system